jgi:chemotaxis receptor (MCP) glutamine deamidase CheD
MASRSGPRSCEWARLLIRRLPYCPTDLTAEKRLVTARRYVDFSIRQLAWQFDQLDVSRGEVQVKVFGGAEVVGLGIGSAAKPVIGKAE